MRLRSKFQRLYCSYSILNTSLNLSNYKFTNKHKHMHTKDIY